MDSWSCLSPETPFHAGIHENAHQPPQISEHVPETHSYSFFVLFLSLKRAILLMGEQEVWPIPCCEWRAWDVSGLKPEQGSEKVQTRTQQNEPCVTQESWVSHRAGTGILRLQWMWGIKPTLQCWCKRFCRWYFVPQIYSLCLCSNWCLSVTLTLKISCIEAFFTIEPQKSQLIFKH